jgi:hypothetical protein
MAEMIFLKCKDRSDDMLWLFLALAAWFNEMWE